MDLVGANNVTQVFPVGMPNSDLVVKDEDDNIITELDQFSGDQNVPAAINIENSTDVIIGPVTQFHGPVTIYQNVNGRQAIGGSAENGSNSYLNENLNTTSSKASLAGTKESKFYNKKYRTLIILPIILIVIATTVSLLVVFLQKPEKQQPPAPDTPTDVTLSPLGPGQVITKDVWGGEPTLNWSTPMTLKHPTPFVILSHTATPQCNDFQSCADRMKSIQNFHVSGGKSPDIGYNFLVGSDGNAYVGRGWDIRNFHSPDSIGISYIGNYVYNELTPDMIAITQKLLRDGVEMGKLDKDYKLICHNQTFNTLSPGQNVYKVVKTWPHFDSKVYY